MRMSNPLGGLGVLAVQGLPPRRQGRQGRIAFGGWWTKPAVALFSGRKYPTIGMKSDERQVMAVQSFLSYALTVPDLEAGRRFYTTFGLNAAERDNALAFCCEGRDQDQVLLVEGRKKRLNHLRFGTDERGLADIRAKMRDRGVAEIDASHNAFGGGLWLKDPNGNAINVRLDQAKPW